MLARAILILSCLFCTRALAQSSDDPPPGTTILSAEVATTPTSTPTPPPEDPQAIKNAVPVDHAALAPTATETPTKRPLDADPMFTPAVVLIGTGGAALLASLFTGLGAHGIYTSLEKECPNDICTGDKQQRIDSGETLAMVSTVLTGVGIAAAGVGTVLLVLAATKEDQPPQSNFGFSSLRLTSGPTPLGIGAAGSF